jgi:hypothetical protein
MAVHLLTDPVASYEGPLVLYGVLAGLILRLRTGATTAAPRWSFRWCLVPFTPLVLWVAYREIASGLAHQQRDPLVALERTLRPDTAVHAFDVLEAQADPLRLAQAADLMNRLMPSSGFDIQARVTLARQAGQPADEVAAQVRELTRRPTWMAGYLRLAELLRGHPQLVPSVPQGLALRSLYATGATRVPPPLIPDDPRIQRMEAAADAQVAVYWLLTQGRNEEAERLLRPLVTRYGHLPDVAVLALCAQANRPEGAIRWSAEDCARLRAGCTGQGAALFEATLNTSVNDAKAANIRPFLEQVLPERR